MSKEPLNSIPREVALQLCGETRQENAKKLFSVSKMQCNVCYRLGRENSARLCIFGNEENRGCTQVNNHYDRTII